MVEKETGHGVRSNTIQWARREGAENLVQDGELKTSVQRNEFHRV